MQGAQDSLWNGDSRPLMRKPESWLRAPTFRGGFTLDLSGAELFCALGAVAVFDAGFIAVLALAVLSQLLRPSWPNLTVWYLRVGSGR